MRFKDDNENKFPDWEESKLEDICEKQSSSISANKIEDNIGDYPIYGATGILKKIDFYEVENDYLSIIKDGAGVGRLLYCIGKSSVLGTLDIIKPKDINLFFLYLLLSRIDFKKYITGSTIPHIYFKDYKKEKVQIPSLKEQEIIANFFKCLDDKINIENSLLTQY
ncbi:restriction endonuclease subunit S, partial [Chryseobacterium scophthalmum]|uniref:restriction endonuclease subunit S n=1 Tax=Chryseobacterium scophthalmum TaxID=59733 RepID=UPI001F453338